MDLDEFFTTTGGFGKYQKAHYLLLCISGALTTFSTMSYVFITAVPDHWCGSPPDSEFGNMSVEERRSLTIPVDASGKYSQCEMYDWSVMSRGNGTVDVAYSYSANSSVTAMTNVSELPVVACQSWEYNTSYYTHTAVTKWDLICGQEWVVVSVGAALGIGKLVFAFLVGVVADRFGRKRALLIFTCAQTLTGILSGFSVNPTMLIAICVFLGGTCLAAYASAFILAIELVGRQYRVFAGIGVYMAWAVGYMVVAFVAYFARDWTLLQLILHAPMVVVVALHAWLLPESPRWLIQQRRYDEAIVVLKNIARWNGVQWDEKMEQIKTTCVETKAHMDNKTLFISLIKSKWMSVYTIVNSLLWFCSNLLFFGLSYNSSNLFGDPYINFAITGAVEFPALILAYFLLNSRLGRRMSTFLTMMLAAVALLATVPIPEEYAILVTCLAMVGKFGITANFSIIFIYTPEMYPTSFRSVTMGTASTIGRLGVIVAPYFAIMDKIYFRELPLLIFGLTSMVVAGTTFLLPETKSVPLPDTMDDFNNLRHHMVSCGRKKHSQENKDTCSPPEGVMAEQEMTLLATA